MLHSTVFPLFQREGKERDTACHVDYLVNPKSEMRFLIDKTIKHNANLSESPFKSQYFQACREKCVFLDPS